MESKKVWKAILKQDVSKGRRTIKCKEIFKMKRNESFWARLVACRYSQIPGIDSKVSFVPLIIDVRFRVMSITKLMCGIQVSVVNVKTAFLHGYFSEEIYMNIPEGLNEDQHHCLLLKKSIYGFVKSA
jgi:Reverse transcriptase (RNA-dependent DNA polymerase)